MYKKKLVVMSAVAMFSSHALAVDILDDVVVSSKSNKSVSDLSGAVTIITAEDIAKTNATNIKDVLVKTAGIIEGVNEASTDGRKSISIRGVGSSYIQILIDGKKINPTDGYIKHSDYQYSWVPIDMIERIEVIKGSKSSIYGSSAIGGVVNIITKKDSRKFYGEVDIQTGISSADNGGDETKLNANIGGKITDKLSFILGASVGDRKTTSGYGSTMFGTSNNATFIEGIESKNGSVKLVYDIDDTQNISASYIKGKENREHEDNPEYYTLDRDMYSVSYEKNFKDISFNIDYSRSESDSEYNDGGNMNYVHSLKNDDLKVETQISMIKNNYISIGAEASKEAYKRYYPKTGKTKYNFEAKSNAYYIQDEIDLGNTILTLGARVDDHDKYGSEVSSNAGIVYKLSENQRLKASYGEGFKAPSLQEGSSQYSTYSHGYYYGNDDLKSETSKSYEIGYEYYGEETLFKTAFFKTELDNMITGKFIGTGYPFGPTMPIKKYKYVNIAEATIQGLELEVDHELNENHFIKVNYTRIKTEDKTTNDDIAYKPKDTFNVGLSSEFRYGISSYISATYKGTQYDSDDKKISGYTITNAQISKKITDQLTARLGMDNITDKNFKDGEPYRIKRRFTYIGINYKF